MEQCPYDDCGFEGSEADVDEHITYMIGVVQDPDHAADKRR